MLFRSQRALDALPEEFKLAVILCDVEELSYEEIAFSLGVAVGTVMPKRCSMLAIDCTV